MDQTNYSKSVDQLVSGTELVPPGQEKPPEEPTTGVVKDGQVYQEAEP